MFLCFLFFFKHKTAYEIRISDWSSDVCSSDLPPVPSALAKPPPRAGLPHGTPSTGQTAATPRKAPATTARLHGRAPCAASRPPAIPARSRCTPSSRAIVAATPPPPRSEERLAGKEGVRQGKTRWSAHKSKKKKQKEK